MTAKRVLACATLLALGACASPQTTISRESPSEAATNKIMLTLKQKDMDRCFTPQFKDAGNSTKIVIYDVIKQNNPKKQCSVFFTSDGHGGFVPTMRASYHEGMGSEACDLKVLSCVRPAEAKRIAARHGLTIDPAPFAK